MPTRSPLLAGTKSAGVSVPPWWPPRRQGCHFSRAGRLFRSGNYSPALLPLQGQKWKWQEM